MLDRVLFIIILSLFFLVPASIVYADDNDHYQNLSLYKLIPSDTTNFYRYVTTFNPPETAQWFTTRDAACSNLFLMSFSDLSTSSASPASWKIEVSNCSITVNNNTSGSYVRKFSYSLSTKSVAATCDVNSDSTFIQFYVKGVTTVPKNKACLGSCEYQHVPESGGGNPTATPTKSQNSDVNDITRFAIPSAKMTGSACELITCPVNDPLCSNNPPDPPDEDDCPQSEKDSNSGQCNTPDQDGNECPESEKNANAGKCNTPDADGNRCTDALKAASGGKCPTQGEGDCTAEQKAANGGKCPAGSGGTCTANPINKKFCDFIDWVTGGDDFKTPDTQKVSINDDMPSSIPIDQIDSNRVVFSASCPPDIVIPINVGQGSGNIRLPFQPMCDFALMLRPFIIAMAYLSGAYIVLGLSKD